MLLRTPSLVILALLAAACASSSPPGNDGTRGEEPTQAAIDPSSVGAECTPSCSHSGDATCASSTPAEVCPERYCFAEGDVDNQDSYCSAGCDDRTCPTGYTCEATKVTQITNPVGALASKICRETHDPVDTPGSCGNGMVEAGDTCDDGNTEDLDRCSQDCATADPPRVDLTLDFGPTDAPSHAHLTGRLPIKGDSDGCSAVDVTKSDATNVVIVATL